MDSNSCYNPSPNKYHSSCSSREPSDEDQADETVDNVLQVSAVKSDKDDTEGLGD